MTLFVDLVRTDHWFVRAYAHTAVVGDPGYDALLAWVKFHRLDPHNMPREGMLVRDDHLHRITYTAFVRDADGKIVADGNYPDPGPVTQIVVDQGEAGPMPFPDAPFTLLGYLAVSTIEKAYPEATASAVTAFDRIARNTTIPIKSTAPPWRPTKR